MIRAHIERGPWGIKGGGFDAGAYMPADMDVNRIYTLNVPGWQDGCWGRL